MVKDVGEKEVPLLQQIVTNVPLGLDCWVIDPVSATARTSDYFMGNLLLSCTVNLSHAFNLQFITRLLIIRQK